MSVICLEGLDGTGKSSVATALSTYFGATVVRNPGTTPLASEIREVLLHKTSVEVPPEEACLLFTAATISTMRRAREMSDAGTRVVLDRGFHSTVAYQGASGCPREVLSAARSCIPQAIFPDRVFYLMVAEHERLRRITSAKGRGADRFEQKPTEYFRKVASGYAEQMSTMYPIDASYSVYDVAHTIAEISGWK